MARTRAQGRVEENGKPPKPASAADIKESGASKSSGKLIKSALSKRKKSEKEEVDVEPKPEKTSAGPAVKRTSTQQTNSLSSKGSNGKKEKEPKPESEEAKTSKRTSSKRKKLDRKEEHNGEPEQEKPALKKAKAAKQTQSKKQEAPAADSRKDSSPPNPTIAKLLDKYGQLPFSDMGLSSPKSPTAETMLAHLIHAMLTSTRISHNIAAQTLKCVIEAGYHDVNVLKRSSWEERTEILTKGGYTHYREKTATRLGDLADLVLNEYNGDLNNLLKASNEDPTTIRNHIKAIKGFGNVAVDVFCDTAQALWSCLAPFVDARSLKTAEHLGLGKDVQKLYEQVGNDPEQMCRLSAALTTMRLDKKEKEFV